MHKCSRKPYRVSMSDFLLRERDSLPLVLISLNACNVRTCCCATNEPVCYEQDGSQIARCISAEAKPEILDGKNCKIINIWWVSLLSKQHRACTWSRRFVLNLRKLRCDWMRSVNVNKKIGLKQPAPSVVNRQTNLISVGKHKCKQKNRAQTACALSDRPSN